MSKPWELIALDSMGPFPEDENGNKFIIVVIDVFSRFVELYAVPELTAENSAKVLIEYTSRYATPDRILTDNGKEYVNTIMKELVKLLYTRHLTILPYSHEENAIVERENKEVLRHLRAIVFDRKIKTKWSLALSLIQRFLNTTDVSSTGFPPNHIIFGNNAQLESSVLYNRQEKNVEARQPKIFGQFKKDSNSTSYTKYIHDLLNIQAEILARAQQIQSIVANEHIKRKNKERQTSSDTDLELNSYVLWERPEGILNKDSRPDKLSSHYRGPYRVISQQESRINIQNVTTKQIHTVHISKLVPFKFDPNIVNPQTVALHADQEFEVGEILDIKGRRKKDNTFYRKDLQVKVLWKGYPIEEATWEPYSEFKGNNKFYDFCKANNHMDLIDQRLFSDD